MYNKNHYEYTITPRCSRRRLAEDVNIYPEFGGARKAGQPEVIVGCLTTYSSNFHGRDPM